MQENPTDDALAVYLLQQFTEKTVKALLVVDGVDPSSEGRNFYTHANMYLYLRFMHRTLDQPGLREALASFDAAGTIGDKSFGEWIAVIESLKALSESRSAVRREDVGEREFNSLQFWNEFSAMRSESIAAILDSIETVRQFGERNIRSLEVSHFQIEIPESLAESDDPVRDFLALEAEPTIGLGVALPESHRGTMEQIVRAVMGSEGLEDLRAKIRDSEGTFEFSVDDVADSVDELAASLSIFVLATVTFPHESPCRYPAPPDAQDDPIEAGLHGNLGTEHYRPPLGIVVQLNALIQEARYVSSAIGEDFFTGW